MQVHLLCIFDNDNETELYKYEWTSIFLLSSKKPSSTTTARPITSSLSTTKAVDKTGYYSGGEDTEVDDDGKISTKPNTLQVI
jgi:hypothetical protein